jgi:predicted ATPase/class 3 adenylate cyclase
MPDLPSGTVTFLFTDIEGSTRLWERDRTAMAAAVERHIALLDTAIQAHGGIHFKTVGDAVQVAFRTATQALAAAAEGQRALLREEWGEIGPLRVRMALHVGEAVPDARGDYLAPVLNRLSRLLSSGSGAQILLSQAVQQLVRGALPDNVALQDLGEYRLRDLLEPERIYQVLHPDLPNQFPLLKSLEHRPHNLPLQATPFLGREREVGEVVELLQRPDVRLLTLTGPGGIGKSRLALQAAAELLDDFPDGVYFVPLAPLTDPAFVLSAIAGALGLREEGGQPLLDRLSAFLGAKRLLLVVDNLEHLVEAAPHLSHLLEASPGLKALTTSRMPLRLRAEREYPVPPLELPRRNPPLPPEQLSQYEAVRLFIERAQAVKPDFAVDNANAPALAEICHRLDGLPLAIELAAARIRILSPQAMLARMEKRLLLLTGGARDAPQRQRTLRDAIAWSHDLLDPEEHALFRRLAVFAGGATYEAVEEVANPDREVDVLGALERLVEHSLLRQDEGLSSEPRFAMLETIREFALEQLETVGEAADGHQRHAAYFLAVTASAGPTLRSRGQLPWLERLEDDHDNLRAAIEWAITHDADAALALSANLAWFWHYRGFVSEGRTWLDRALALASGTTSPGRTAALLGAATLADVQSDTDRTAELAAEALTATQCTGDRASETYAHLLLGLSARDCGDSEAGQQRLEEAHALALQTGDRWTEALSCLNLAGTPWNQGDYKRTAALLDAGLAAAEAAGDAWVITSARSVRGLLASDQGDPAKAIALLEESLAQQRVYRDPIGAQSSLLWLGIALRQHGDLDRAEAHLVEALDTARYLGDAWHIAASLAALGEVALARGHPRLALERSRDALRTPASARLIQSWQVRALANALVAVGRADAGVYLFGAEARTRLQSREQLMPSDERDFAEALRRARAALGDVNFDAAWAGGQETPLEQTLAHALDVADEAVGDPP